MSLVAAGLGSGLVAASPVGPGESVGRAVDGPDDERDEQALDLVAGEGYQFVRLRVTGMFVGEDDGKEGVGEHH